MNKVHNTLYKKDSKGKIREWSIYTGEENGIPFYSVKHGEKDGALQETKVHVPNGKNVGKKNETTARQQCALEANSLYERQIERKGYTLEIPTEVPYRPMLAHVYNDFKHKLEWPAAVSPKLDGCLAGDSLVKTKEYGYVTIKYIVENKLECSVLSYNTKSHKNEYKKVLNYFENREIDETIVWYEIETSDGKTLKLTGNHKVFLPELNCWRRVDQLDGTENLMEI